MANEPIVSEKTLKELVRLGQTVGEAKSANGTIPYAIVPQDCRVEDLSKFVYNQYATAPHRKIAAVKVLDAVSFIEYYTLFSDPNSRVFADETKSQVLAVLDYHGAMEGGPRWCQHTVELALRHSEEWETWIGQNGIENKMAQMEFAEFIEDNTPDIKEPSAATMLEMARTLQAKTEVDFSSAIRLNNGQVQLTYNEQVKGSYGNGKVEIPEEFLICIPVYVGAPRVPIRARLRYRIVTGKLSIWYDLLRPEEVERKAFQDTLAAVKDGLGITIINGNPK